MTVTEPASTDKFSGNEVPTLGVEEEFVLVERRTVRPSLRSTEVLAAGAELGIEMQHEFTTCQVETATGVAAHIRDLSEPLCRARIAAATAAARAGCRLLAIGTPVFDPPPDSITDTPRYRRMAELLGRLATGVMGGCHIHVGVVDREQAVQVSNRLRPWLPTLLALSANSPIAGGIDTGYASWRHIRFGRWPSAGPPPYFESADHYDDAVARLLEAGSILDRGMIYWDVRASEHLPTVEIRISDVPATIAETITVVTVVHALVITALEAVERGEPAPTLGQEQLRAACWRAARDGATGCALDPVTNCLIPVSLAFEQLLTHIRPALEELGEYRRVADGVAEVLTHGNGAVRQRRVLARRERLSDVVADCVRRTVEGCAD